jgi:hypothetical protein
MSSRSPNAMRLLVITQKINNTDPVLGFFHQWIAEFAKRAESIIAICLEKGTCALPANVRVRSLGKEVRPSRLLYLVHFFTYLWQERKNYDAVLVHMNQEYVLLGALPWRLLGKKIYMWRNHHSGSVFTQIAGYLCNKVF